jgi:uncharacterized protein DUF4397
MLRLSSVTGIALLSLLAACGSDSTTACCNVDQPSLRVVNAFTSPIDVLVDGNVAIASLPAGTIGTAAPASGAHSVVLRPSGGASATQSVTTTSGSVSTIAAVRAASGSVSSVALDDTNSIVPAGATKVRVIHFAANAGTLQVYRTQPDFPQPVSWQFPFNYQPTPTSLSAPFYQSTPGSWEVRIWQTPADASGWANAPVKVVIPLTSGQKKTVVILDKPGGGVRVELL